MKPESARSARHQLIAGALVVVALFVAYFLVPFDREWAFCAALAVVMLGSAGPLAIRGMRRTMSSVHPLVEAVNALMLILALLVIAFASLYFLLATRSAGQISGIETKLDAVYFTVTIVATVGFGDITATGQAARAIVTVNMVLDLLFLGATFRLLTWAVQKRRKV